MQLFYADNIEADFYQFTEQESKHLVRVLRKKTGDTIMVTDGKGHLFTTAIIDDHPKRATVQIQEKKYFAPSNRNIHIAIAPTKNNDRIEWFIEKAVEIGVSEISFIECDNSERSKIKIERFEKVAISALKQSNQYHLPRLNDVIGFNDFCSKCCSNVKLVAHCESDTEKRTLNTFQDLSDVCLLIGPEGDFTPIEIETSKSFGFVPSSLGETRLRTETAGVVAVTLLNNL